jgi:hypothetical protein
MNVGTVSRWFGAVALIVGPLAMAAGSLLAPASDNDSISASLTKIAAHPSAERGLIVCDLLAAFLIPAILYLMRLSGPRAPKVTMVGGALAIAGLLGGLVSLGASDLLYYHAALLPDRVSAATLVHAVTIDPAFVIPEAVFLVGHALGLLLLGIALWRSRAVPRWAAALLGLAFIVQFPVHDQAVLSAGTGLLFLIGSAVCALTLLRAEPKTDPAFIAGTDPLVTSAAPTR